MFLRESWYVFGWSYEVTDQPLGRVMIEQPVVVWRNSAGVLHAAEDRCPHRHAPLSFGRVEGDRLRCMYHGLVFDESGTCVDGPAMDPPPQCSIRKYPVVEKDSWIWVWMGDPAGADEALIPKAWGIDDPDKPMRSHSIEYDAHYQLIHDNLCDLSHVDFVHEQTLKVASGADWSKTQPKIIPGDRSLKYERWFENAVLPSDNSVKVDTWSTYDFFAPGIFILYGARFPAGTAAQCNYEAPKDVTPIFENIEQQAVTPISENRTAYYYATGLIMDAENVTDQVKARMDVIIKTFEEDRNIIEGQQKIWDLTDPNKQRVFLPQDKGPTLMRRMLTRLISEQNS